MRQEIGGGEKCAFSRGYAILYEMLFLFHTPKSNCFMSPAYS